MMAIASTLLSYLTILALVACAVFVIYLFTRRTIRKYNYPLWIIVLNVIACVPIVAAPFVLFMSVFMFDNPSNEIVAILSFLAINSYSVVLYWGARLSLKLFGKNYKLLSAIIPVFLSVIVYGIVSLFFIVV